MNIIKKLSKGLLLAAGILLMYTTASLAQTGQLKGTVTEAESNEPLPGINIGIKGTTLGDATGTNGKFTITQIPAGSHTVQITAVGYKKVSRKITIEDGATTKISVELEKDILGINEVVVSATRSVESLDEVPASVNILRAKELNEQLTLSSDLNDLLAKYVPGFAQSTESASNWGQNLRGRDYLVLIDGIPQSTPLRRVSRDLQTIDAGVVSRIEVIKGATAIYGNGATGGLINYITTLPQKDGFESISKVGSNVSLSAPANSTGYRFSQQFMGRNDRLSYNFKGSFEEKGLFKDATGDIIPTNPQGQGGLSDASVYNLYGQVGYDLNSQHHIEAMYNFYSNDQETDYVTVAGNYPDQKATAQKGEVRGEPQGTRANHNARLAYSWVNFWGNTSLDATAYLQDYETLFGYTTYYRDGGQSYLLSEKAGFRLNLESPFSFTENIDGSVVYGVDLLSDNTQQKLIDGRTFTPKMKMRNYAPYAQLKAIFHENWVLKGGMRYEDINIDVPSYTTVEHIDGTGGYQGGVDIEGGSLDYSAFTYNVGLSYNKFQPSIPL